MSAGHLSVVVALVATVLACGRGGGGTGSPASVAPTPARARHALSVTRAGDGDGRVTSAPLGIDCGATCTAWFDAADVVTLTAVAAEGSRFDGWSGAGCSGSTPCGVTLTGEEAVAAVFGQLPPLLVSGPGAVR
jgi:hypothetical protein